MRRCRGAQLHGGTVREAFQIAGERVPATGYVHAIRPNFTSSPLRWTIVIEAEKTTLRPDRAERPRSPTMTAVGTNAKSPSHSCQQRSSWATLVSPPGRDAV